MNQKILSIAILLFSINLSCKVINLDELDNPKQDIFDAVNKITSKNFNLKKYNKTIDWAEEHDSEKFSELAKKSISILELQKKYLLPKDEARLLELVIELEGKRLEMQKETIIMKEETIRQNNKDFKYIVWGTIGTAACLIFFGYLSLDYENVEVGEGAGGTIFCFSFDKFLRQIGFRK